MGLFLGIDTSNYTTSMALFDSKSGKLIQQKKLLPVEKGMLGLRQSEALFQHVRQLPELAALLFNGQPSVKLDGIGVSTQPRRREDSYMPCFLAGYSQAGTMGAALKIPVFPFSHQEGHIAAALYGSGHLDWLNGPFLAFHFSGGTSEALLVSPDGVRMDIQKVAGSLDLKAGQAVDRVGQMLGLPFPAGPQMELLAEQSSKKFSVKPVMKGCDCSLSGVENRCRSMLEKGEQPADIARYCLDFLLSSLCGMTMALLEQYPKYPLLYAGGVMSNRYIRQEMESRFGGVFCPPVFSSDNAAGVAVLAAQVAREV